MEVILLWTCLSVSLGYVSKILYLFISFYFISAIGFNVETVQYNNIKFQVWDLGIFPLSCFTNLKSMEISIWLTIFLFLVYDRGTNKYQVNYLLCIIYVYVYAMKAFLC